MIHVQDALLRPEALAQLRPRLLEFAMRRMRNPAQAEDAVQDTLVAAFEAIHGYAADSSPRTWLTGILKHKIVDCVRRSAREPWPELDGDGVMPGIADTASGQAGGRAYAMAGWGDPERALSASRFLDALERFVDELPGKAGRVFVLREVIGMNTTEVCRELEISANHCSVLLHRARTRIRERLYGHGFVAGESA